MDTSPEPLLTTRDVARWTGYTEKTLRNWRHEGVGPDWLKLGPRQVRYTRAAVQRWLDTNTTPRPGDRLGS